MKTAIYIEDGVTQLVLTPETDWERSVVNSITKGEQQTTVLSGHFYECQGGWFRQGFDGDSLILRLDAKPNPDPTHDRP